MKLLAFDGVHQTEGQREGRELLVVREKLSELQVERHVKLARDDTLVLKLANVCIVQSSSL